MTFKTRFSLTISVGKEKCMKEIAHDLIDKQRIWSDFLFFGFNSSMTFIFRKLNILPYKTLNCLKYN